MAVSSHKGTKPEDHNPVGPGFIKGSKSHTIVSERQRLLHTKVRLDRLAVQIKLPEETFVKLFVNPARMFESLGKKIQLPHFTDAKHRTGFKFLKLDDWKRYSADAAAAAAPDIEAAVAALRHMHDCEVNKAKATAANEDVEFSSDAALQQAINESKTEAAQREELRAKEAVASAHAQSAGPAAPQWRPRYKGDTGKRKANP